MINIVFNYVWGSEIALEMTFLGVAGFTAIISYILYILNRAREARLGGLIAFILPIISLAILNAHLLKPEASYLILLSPNTSSWMVYGAVSIVLFILFTALFEAPLVLPRIGFWGRSRESMIVIGALMSIFGIVISIYPGFLLAYERGVPIWCGAGVPLVSLFMGAIGGVAIYSITLYRDKRLSLSLAILIALLLSIFIIHLYLALFRGEAMRISSQVILNSTEFRAGLASSLIALALSLVNTRTRSLVIAMLAGVSSLVAIYLLRLALLQYGAWFPPII